MEGWIKIYKKFLNWEWYDDINVKVVFLHLLLTANYVDKQWKGITIKRGQVLTSITHLAKEIQLTNQQTKTAIKKLKSTNEITIKSTNKYTVITIEKYNDYQDDYIKSNQQNNQQNNQQVTSKITNKITNKLTNEQPQHKNIKNKKNNKKENNKKKKEFEIVELYNSTTPLLPHVQKLTPKREKAIKEFLKEFTVDEFKRICEIANSNSFLTGNNDRRVESRL